jgi:hypothetical protein
MALDPRRGKVSRETLRSGSACWGCQAPSRSGSRPESPKLQPEILVGSKSYNLFLMYKWNGCRTNVSRETFVARPLPSSSQIQRGPFRGSRMRFAWGANVGRELLLLRAVRGHGQHWRNWFQNQFADSIQKSGLVAKVGGELLLLGAVRAGGQRWPNWFRNQLPARPSCVGAGNNVGRCDSVRTSFRGANVGGELLLLGAVRAHGQHL